MVHADRFRHACGVVGTHTSSSKKMAMKMPKIKPMTLPENYPTPQAMTSWNQNEHNYEPEMWALEYGIRRYLSRMPESDLRDRYTDIVRNMGSYTGPERDPIPINSYQSSWYWFRKEYQTRLEFSLRDIDPPALDYVPMNSNGGGPENPKVPNGTKILFRYSKKKYMQKMIEQGQIRFSPAESYEDEENNQARRDDELHKHAYIPGEHATITDQSGRRIDVLGDIRRTVTGTRYHLLCLSCVWNSDLFADFEADTCVAVSDPQEFSRRIETEGRAVFPGWYFHDCPVQYFDPFEQGKNEFFDSAMSKDFRFAHQNEYRILWAQMSAAPVISHKCIEIGPALDIMTMYTVDGEEIGL